MMILSWMQLKYVKDLMIFWAHAQLAISRPSTTLITKSKAELMRKYLPGGSYNHKYTLMACYGNIFLPVFDLLLLSVTQHICFNSVAVTHACS